MKRLLTICCVFVLVGLNSSTISAAVIGLDAVHAGTTSTESLGTGSTFEAMRTELQNAGYTLQILYDFEPASLSSCDAIFVSQARFVLEEFTSQEILNIRSYVADGKGLLAIAEAGYATGSTVDNFNTLIDPYGVEINSSASSDNGYLVSGFVPHPVTDGVNNVGLDFQRYFVSILSPAIDLTLGSGEDDCLAAVDGLSGSGNVVIMSDTAHFSYPGDDANLYEYDNLQLLLNVTAYLVPEPVSFGNVAFDIKPGSCPNPLNVKSNGVLPVAILGSDVFDVKDIDVASLEILGVRPIRSGIEDVSAPLAEEALAEDCLCTNDGPDGYLDLTLKFDTQDIVEAVGEVEDGDYVILTLTGSLLDGLPIEGTDCVLILKKGKP